MPHPPDRSPGDGPDALSLLGRVWGESDPSRASDPATTDHAAGDPAATTDLGGRSPGPVGGSAPAAVGRFRIVRQLGAGGFGLVFAALDPTIGRPVALKLARPEFAFDPAGRDRFLAEARLAGGLEHPGIVRVLEAGDADGVWYIASELCDGPDLSAWLRGQADPVTPRAAAALTQRIAQAVGAAHEAGVVHRDLKPANVLLVRPPGPAAPPPDLLPGGWVPKVTDFGLAKLAEGGVDRTRSGAVAGTPQYMAPEQAAGSRRLGPPADVWALGVVLYEVLTGLSPFRGESVVDTLRLVCDTEPPSPRRLRPGLPRDLETICLKCLQKDPARRYATAAEVAADLGRFLDGRAVLARPVGRAEKAWKWCRRNPAAAGLSVAVGLAAVGLVATLLVSDRQVRAALGRETEANATLTRTNEQLGEERGKLADANQQLTIEQANLASANTALKKAVADEKAATRAARKQAYNLGVSIAGREWLAKNLEAMEKQLDELPPEMREWEWYFLKRQATTGFVQFEAAPAAARIADLQFTPTGAHLLVTASLPDEKGENISFLRRIAVPDGKLHSEWRPNPVGLPSRILPQIRAINSDGTRAVVMVIPPRPEPQPGRPAPPVPKSENHILEVGTDRIVCRLAAHPEAQSGLRDVVFSADGSSVYASAELYNPVGGNRRNVLLKFDAASGELRQTWTPPEKHTASEFHIDPKEQYVVFSLTPTPGVAQFGFVVVDLATGREVTRINRGGADNVSHPPLVFTPEGTLIVGAMTATYEYRLSNGQLVRTLPFAMPGPIRLDPSGSILTVPLYSDIQLVDRRSGAVLATAPVLGSSSVREPMPISATGWQAVEQKGNRVAIYRIDQTVRGDLVPLPGGGLPSPGPDNRYLTHGVVNPVTQARQLHFYSLTTGKRVGEIDFPQRAPGLPAPKTNAHGTLTWGPDGFFATAIQDDALTCRVYRVGESGIDRVGEWEFLRPTVSCLVLAIDGRGRVLLNNRDSATEDGPRGTSVVRNRILCCDPATDKPPLVVSQVEWRTGPNRPPEFTTQYYPGQFSPDGKWVAASIASTNRAAKQDSVELVIWNTETWKVQATLLLATGPSGTGIGVGTIQFLPDSSRLVVGVRRPGGMNRKMSLVEVTTGRVLPADVWEGGIPERLDFSPDGRRAAGTVFPSDTAEPLFGVWDVQTGRNLWVRPGRYMHAKFMGTSSRLAATRQRVGAAVTVDLIVFDAATGQELVTLPRAAAGGGLHFYPTGAILRTHGSFETGRAGTWRSQHGVRAFDGSPLPATPKR